MSKKLRLFMNIFS